MEDIIRFECLENKLVEINGQLVLLDRDVALLFGVETKSLNQAIKRNTDKFPNDYMFELSQDELSDLRSQNVTANLNMVRYKPKVFTEKGLYMIATILKSSKAIEATFIIIETFAKIKQLNRNINTIIKIDDEPKQKSLMEKSNEILDDVLDIIFEESDDNNATEIETKIELNLGIYKKTKITKQKRADK